ncbi:hypothetical protein N9950_01075, partial [Akkermansiaceae bacterium]|nr:hypothetical protein [Akkermansiaceae bacterium]
FSEAVHRLIGLGHRRVVHICRGDRRKPNPGKSEQKFLEILASHGLPVGDYNLPDWVKRQETRSWPSGFKIFSFSWIGKGCVSVRKKPLEMALPNQICPALLYDPSK